MRYFVQLNELNICNGTQQSVKEVIGEKTVEVTENIETIPLDWYMFRKYENGQWSEELFKSETNTEPTLEDKINFLYYREKGLI